MNLKHVLLSTVVVQLCGCSVIADGVLPVRENRPIDPEEYGVAGILAYADDFSDFQNSIYAGSPVFMVYENELSGDSVLTMGSSQRRISTARSSRERDFSCLEDGCVIMPLAFDYDILHTFVLWLKPDYDPSDEASYSPVEGEDFIFTEKFEYTRGQGDLIFEVSLE